jgi:hypothetical protein
VSIAGIVHSFQASDHLDSNLDNIFLRKQSSRFLNISLKITEFNPFEHQHDPKGIVVPAMEVNKQPGILILKFQSATAPLDRHSRI